MRFEARKVVFPENFVKRFTDLFSPSQEEYRRINRVLAQGRVDEIATFLLDQNIKFTAQQIRNARQSDGTLTPEFVNQINHVCAVDELYKELSQMLRNLT